VLLDPGEARALQQAMFAGGKLASEFIARDAPAIARRAGLARPALAAARFLVVEESGVGPGHPFSGEKLSPVLAFYRAADFAGATSLAERLLRHQGAGHSVGLHTREDARAVELGLTLPVCRVIVNQAHCFATGGNFDNALPFSLSMGCGTWGRNSISQSELPPLPQHHARRATAACGSRRGADRGGAVRRVSRQDRPQVRAQVRRIAAPQRARSERRSTRRLRRAPTRPSCWRPSPMQS
jgi:hypothetical protein